MADGDAGWRRGVGLKEELVRGDQEFKQAWNLITCQNTDNATVWSPTLNAFRNDYTFPRETIPRMNAPLSESETDIAERLVSYGLRSM